MQTVLGLAALMRRYLAGEDLNPLCQSLLERAAQNPDEAAALLDAAIIMQFRGQPTVAQQLQQEALRLERCYRINAPAPAKLRLLALVAPGELMANVPLECLLEQSDIELLLYYVSTELPADLPKHDLLFVAIGESSVNRPLLAAWQTHLANWSVPVLNAPQHIANLARDVAAQQLQNVPNVLMPMTWQITRAMLTQLAAGAAPANCQLPTLQFPVIVRPIDSHAGHALTQTIDSNALAAQLPDLPGEHFFIAPFVDYRSSDGQFRKYRIAMIGGEPFAVHMGISADWMIHYLNAGMAESAVKRAEEAAFMAQFAENFVQRHGAALQAIHERLGLNYFGIDCAEMPDGRLLIFEVDHAMVVHALDDVTLFPYKQPAMQRLFTAFRALLLTAADSVNT
ncbi:RimK family alpha-L-glutamate ligase [Chromatium weissei]|nr:RimK family alpha-L-glutamate ligase [Chromatium weissei]